MVVTQAALGMAWTLRGPRQTFGAGWEWICEWDFVHEEAACGGAV